MPREITVEPQGPVSRITQDAVRDYIEQIDSEAMNAYTCTVPVETSLTVEMLMASISDLPPLMNCRCVVDVNGELYALEFTPMLIDVPPRPNMSDTFDAFLNRQLRGNMIVGIDYGREDRTVVRTERSEELERWGRSSNVRSTGELSLQRCTR